MAETSTPDGGVNQSIVDYIEVMSLDIEGRLADIALSLRSITRQDGLLISQASLKDLADVERQAEARDRRNSNPARDARRQDRQGGSYSVKDDSRSTYGNTSGRRSSKSFFDDLTEGFENQLKKDLFGSEKPFSDMLKNSLTDLADKLGTDVDHLGSTVGQKLGKMAVNSLKNSSFGSRLTEEWKRMGDMFKSDAQGAFSRFSDALANASDDQTLGGFFREARGRGAESAQAFSSEELNRVAQDGARAAGDAATNAVGHTLISAADDIGEASEVTSLALSEVAGQSTELIPGFQNLGGSFLETLGPLSQFASAIPWANIALLGLGVAVDALTEAFGPAIEGFKGWWGAVSSAANRYRESNKKNLEYWNERVKADVRTVTEAAFTVIKESAEKALQVWDDVASTVSAAQGYTKAGVQAVWSDYAERLKGAGLSSVVSSADMMGNLKEVLQKGLSGRVAEEFAYMATVLNKAVPTQNFFDYASTYASIAANAAKSGKSLDDALAVANEQLVGFASNLLYADRQIAGGFATDISKGAALFEDAAKIALSSQDVSRTSDISGVLTSVSAIVSAVAPDLADGLVNAVVDAAVGGNSSTITALRSMSGVGASNTAFLKALTQNPQTVFADLFSNLADLQGMSKDNYMEVAEGLSEVFGIQKEAFARVDFNYLATAISEMELNNEALSENLNLLQSGETTSTADQLRMQKINEYMIEEGLAYVLDSEVGRAVQQHMWEEQQNRELMENEYAVNLQGKSLEFLEGIWNTIQNILDFLNPFSWFKKLMNVAMTEAESKLQRADLEAIVRSQVVGTGSLNELNQLLSSGPTNLIEKANLFGTWSRTTSDGTVVEDTARNYLNMLGYGSALANQRSAQQDWRAATLQTSAFDVVESIAGIKDVVNVARKVIGKQAAQAMRDNAAIAKKSAYTMQLVASQVTSSRFVSESNKTLAAVLKEQATATSLSVKGMDTESAAYKAAKARIDSASQAVESAKATFEKQADTTSESYKSALETYDKAIDNYNTAASEFKSTMGTLASEAITAGMADFIAKSAKKSELSNSYKSGKRVLSDTSIDEELRKQYNLREYVGKIANPNSKGSKDKWIEKEGANKSFLTYENMLDVLNQNSAALAEASFDDWVSQYLTIGKNETLEDVLKGYGTTVEILQSQFASIQSKEASKQEKARQMHETQFWEDMQRFATDLFPEYLNEWKKYYVLHSAYTAETQNAYADALKVTEEDKNQSKEAIMVLANKLASDDTWGNLADKIADPTLQTNMLLSKILLTVTAIMQQNNESSIVSVPAALQSLGLGLNTPIANDGSKKKSTR